MRYGNIIDLVITRADEALLDNVVVDNWLVSDHLAVCCDLKLPPVCVNFEKIQVRKYKSIHKELFKTDLKHSFRTSDTTQCADDLAVEYNEVLSSLCDKHAPLVNIKSKGKPPKPWYSDIIHLARRKRRRVERRWKKTGLEIHRQMFLQQRESVAKLINETKQKYYLNVLTGSTMKDMHKTVRELLNTGGKILFPFLIMLYQKNLQHILAIKLHRFVRNWLELVELSASLMKTLIVQQND